MPVHEHDIDALYSVLPAEFIDARKALATRAKKEGDKEGAARIAALPKPSVAAWTVNQLYRSAKGKVDVLLDAGASLREAHRQGARGVRDVFVAQQAQRAAVDALAHAARSILEKAGLPASETTLARVGETLVSISTLNRWGGGKAGQLAKELAPPGFDALLEVLGSSDEVTPRAKAEPPTAPPPDRAPDREKESRESRASREAQRNAAIEARRKAEANVAEATRDKSHAETRAKATQLEAAETQKNANDAEAKARQLADALKAAEAALAQAKRDASEAAKEASTLADRAEEARTAADKARRVNDAAAEELARAEAHLKAARRAEHPARPNGLS